MNTWLRRVVYVLTALSWLWVGFMLWRAYTYIRVPTAVVLTVAVSLGIAMTLSGAAIVVQSTIIWRAGYHAGRQDGNGHRGKLRSIKPD